MPKYPTSNISNPDEVLSKHLHELLGYQPPSAADCEQDRLKELLELRLLDTGSEERFDRITRMMSQVFDVPIALVSLVDQDRQWFKSHLGLEVQSTDRSISFCGHAVAKNDSLVIEDAKQDERFKGNPLVIGEPHIRFYAGAIIRSKSGLPLGTCCIIDSKPRQFSQEDLTLLESFAEIVKSEALHSLHVEELEKKALSLAYYDEMTGLPNRQLFLDRLDQAIITNDQGRDIFVYTIDASDYLDGADANTGMSRDQMCFNMAIRLRAMLDLSVNVAFLGHGYFAVYDRGKQHAQGINQGHYQVMANRLLEIFEEPVPLGEQEIFVKIKLGVASYPKDSTIAENLLEYSMLASRGNSTVNVYTKDEKKKTEDRLQVQQLVHRGLVDKSYFLQLQPIIKPYGNQLLGFEALARLKIDDDIISPADFIPIAERSYAIIEISDQLLEMLLVNIEAWLLEYPNKVPIISFNLSANHLLLPNLDEHITSIFKRFNVPTDRICFEVTESGLLHDLDLAIENIQSLVDKGFCFALDDFGTGYSSLSYLQRLNVTKLKLDKSFIDHIASKRDDYILVRAITFMAHELGKKVIAEGVETKQQLELLKSINCGGVQGFYYSKPVDLSEVGNIINRQKIDPVG